MHNQIIIKGLRQNNLKNIDLTLPQEKLIVFTGVSGSGKSSIVFDTIAAESQRSMNETYSAWVRGRMPKYPAPKVDSIENLTASVIIDQSRLGGNARSTVGTISDLYSSLRLLYSRIGSPQVGPASYFSFNDPNGMCPTCSGIGKIMDLDIEPFIDPERSWNEGMLSLPAFGVGNYYWKQYTGSGLFDLDKKYKDYSDEERCLLLFGSRTPGGERVHKKVEGIQTQFRRLSLMHGEEEQTDHSMKRIAKLLHETVCPDCGGLRLNERARSSRILGYTIADMCELEFSALIEVLRRIDDPRAQSITAAMTETLQRMIDIGLLYLFMNRETTTLSGGEAQRLKLVRFMGSSLTHMTYIFDEPSVGLHPRDVYRMINLLRGLRDRGNTVLVVEHDKDIIRIADEIVEVGPKAGKNGGRIQYQGDYAGLLQTDTATGIAMRTPVPLKRKVRRPTEFLPVRDACLHNLRHVDVDIPLGVLTVVTGVAGSGKSTLIRDVFAKQYSDRVVLVDQSAITATGRSTVCTYMGFFDEIRRVFAKETGRPVGLFSFNGAGGCPACRGRGAVTTELIFMDPVTSTCEVCGGKRYSAEALEPRYRGKSILEVLELSVEEAAVFFADHAKIAKPLRALLETGLPYLSLGQPLSTFSGGERQRVKLAKELHKKGNIYVLDEPTTGLHAGDIESVMTLLEELVKRGNTVIVIEHNPDVMKQADYIIDIGSDGGSGGGEVMFTGTPEELLKADCITAEYLRRDLVENGGL